MRDVEQIVGALREGRAREALTWVRALRDEGGAPAWRVNELFAACFRQLGDAEGAAAALWRAAQADTVLRSQREHYSGYLFALHYLPDISAEDLAQAARGYARFYREPLQQVSWQKKDSLQLHVGFLAPHFCDSSSARFYEAMVVGLAEMGLEVSLYALSSREDAFTGRLRDEVSRYRDLSALSLTAAAEVIRADGVDVLIDLGGHAEGGVTLMVLAHRPAPVQITAIGWIDSTGLDFVDGVLSDGVLAPEGSGEEAFFSERLVCVPQGCLCFTPTQAMREARARMETITRERLTFGCFQNFLKVNDTVLQAFAEILRQAPSARLILQDVLPLAERADAVRERCAQAGLPMDRVTVRPGRKDYLEDFEAVDVVLDTFPYPGGFMTALPCYLGLPVITIRGSHAWARFGAAVLTAMGQAGQVVEDVAAYIRQAVHYATEPQALSALRTAIRRDPEDGAYPMRTDREAYAKRLYAALHGFYHDKMKQLRQGE